MYEPYALNCDSDTVAPSNPRIVLIGVWKVSVRLSDVVSVAKRVESKSVTPACARAFLYYPVHPIFILMDSGMVEIV